MKKNFSLLLIRIAGGLALLGVVALVLMLIVKLVVTALLLLGIGTLIFKMVNRKGRQFYKGDYKALPAIVAQYEGRKIQPIFDNHSKKSNTIIPVL